MLIEKKLIINADDFGLSENITDAIIDCHRYGVVTSTTLMVNMPAAEYAVSCAKKYPKLGVGIHLVLTQGNPVSHPDLIPDLVDNKGCFHGPRVQARQLWYGKEIYRQVLLELGEQIKKARVLGLNPTHCDSHHGIHRMPVVMKALVSVVKTLDVPRVRNQLGYSWTRPQASVGEKAQWVLNRIPLIHKIIGHRTNNFFLDKNKVRYPDRKLVVRMQIGASGSPKQLLLSGLKNMPVGTSEIICHPGYPALQVLDLPQMAKTRRIDTELMQDQDIKGELKNNNIQLINFSDL